MPRYIALLRGVSPMNAKMPELRACFEQAGFTGVHTVLSSGNVAFDGPESPEPDLVQDIEAAMQAGLGRHFATQVRTIAHLSALLETDPFASFDLPANAKRVVSFLPSSPVTLPALPVIREGARLLAIHGREAFTAYVPDPGNPVFMTLLEKTFGRDITTRTWDTVRKCAVA